MGFSGRIDVEVGDVHQMLYFIIITGIQLIFSCRRVILITLAALIFRYLNLKLVSPGCHSRDGGIVKVCPVGGPELDVCF